MNLATTLKPVVNSWQSHIPPISQTTEGFGYIVCKVLWIADKVISPLYHKQRGWWCVVVHWVVNSWQSHIPPISQTTGEEAEGTSSRLWIADKVISPLYHKQLYNHNLAMVLVVNSWQSHIPPISQTTARGESIELLLLWIADKVISPLYHKQLWYME